MCGVRAAPRVCSSSTKLFLLPFAVADVPSVSIRAYAILPSRTTDWRSSSNPGGWRAVWCRMLFARSFRGHEMLRAANIRRRVRQNLRGKDFSRRDQRSLSELYQRMRKHWVCLWLSRTPRLMSMLSDQICRVFRGKPRLRFHPRFTSGCLSRRHSRLQAIHALTCKKTAQHSPQRFVGMAGTDKRSSFTTDSYSGFKHIPTISAALLEWF
jgi:hypothetical protein